MARADEGAGAPWPAEAAAWGEEARAAFLERLGIADDLVMEVVPGSLSWMIALREARRCAAGVPGGTTGGPVDAALEAFVPSGGLVYLGTLTREQLAALTAAPDLAPGTRHKDEWKHRSLAAPVSPGEADRRREGGR